MSLDTLIYGPWGRSLTVTNVRFVLLHCAFLAEHTGQHPAQ
jgi:hypothetical protein